MKQLEVVKDSKGNAKFRFSKQKNVPSISLYYYELRIIEQVYIHRYMRSSDLIDLFLAYRKKLGLTCTRNAVSQRLERLCKGGILKLRQNETLNYSGFRFNSYFYTVGFRGLEALLKSGYIDEREVKRFNDSLAKSQLPSVHTMASSTLANNIYIHLFERGVIHDKSNIRIVRGSQHHILGVTADVPEEIRGLIVPDYVVETNNVLIALEVDSGRQGKHVITNKVKRYLQFMETDYRKNKELYVIFCQIDSSVAKYTETGNRSKRALSIKTFFDSYFDWPPGFHIYSTPSVTVPSLVQRIVDEIEYMEPVLQSFITNEWIEYTRSVLNVHGTEVRTFEETDLFTLAKNWSPLITADGHISIKRPNKRTRYYIVLRMCAGSVRSYIRYKVYLSRCEAINESEDTPYTVGLILLFDDNQCLQDEIIEPEKNIEVLLTDKKSWMDLAMSGRTVIKKSRLPLYELGTNYSKHLI